MIVCATCSITKLCKIMILCCDSVAFSNHIPQHVCHWKLLSQLGRFRHRSHVAWSCSQSDTPPVRLRDVLLTYRSGSSFGMFTDQRRCYTVQSVKRTKETHSGNSRKFSRPCAASKPSDSMNESKSVCDAKTHSTDGIPATSSAQQLQQHSDKSSGIKQTVGDSDKVVSQMATSEKVGLVQRFRMMYKQYGVVLVCVHAVTTSVWLSLFYTATVSGVDVVPLLRWLGASDTVVSPFFVPGVGKAAVIYLMYKLASPARYAVTIAGTQLAVHFLRRRGYLKVPETHSGKPESLRSIVSDGRAKVKDRMEDLHGDMQELKGRVGQIRSSSRQEKL